MALRWIQRNIAAFGGNPNAVTLCGYSAGSFSIMLHMVSPMSQNLFHRAITMSATDITADIYSGIANGQKQLVKKQAELLDCPTDTTGSMLLCLYTKPVENFTDTLDSLFVSNNDFYSCLNDYEMDPSGSTNVASTSGSLATSLCWDVIVLGICFYFFEKIYRNSYVFFRC